MLGTRAGWVLAAGMSLAAFALYAGTAAPDLGLVDSGELALACATGGVAHPPGFPLYLIAGGLAAKLPFASPARSLNLMSAFFLALGCGGFFLATDRLLSILFGFGSRRAPSNARAEASTAGDSAGASATAADALNAASRAKHADRIRLAASLVASILFATSYNPWTWATVTEVYALNVFLAAFAWFCAAGGVLAFRGADPRANSPSEAATVWRWITAALVFGLLGLANHHATTLPLLPGLFALVAIGATRIIRRARFWRTGGAAAAFAALLYGTLPLASRKNTGLDWGGIESLFLLVRHIAGAQYQVEAEMPPGETARVAREFGELLVSGCGPVALALVVAAFVFVMFDVSRNRRSARRATGLDARASWRDAVSVTTALVLVIAFNLFLSVSYIAGPEDRMAYDLPATMAWCLLAGAGAFGVLRVASAGLPEKSPTVPAFVTAVALISLGGGWNLARNFELCNLRGERTARTYVREVLAAVPSGSLVITSEWNFYSPFLYMRHVENYRPDLNVIDVLMMRRFWYLSHLERTIPHLVDQSRPEFDAFRDQVTRFDLGEPYDMLRIQGLYDALLRRWVELARDESNAYAYVDWTTLDRPQEISWLSGLAWTADGLLLRFVDPPAPDPAPLPAMDSGNLAYVRSKLTDGSLRGDLSGFLPRHDPYRKIWSTYQKSVEMSLLAARHRLGEDGVAELVSRYGWYPEIELAVDKLRRRGERR
jgi:hypothetical protein